MIQLFVYHISSDLSCLLVLSLLVVRQKEFASKIEEADYYIGAMAHEAKSPTSSIAMSVENLLQVINDHSTEKKDQITMNISKDVMGYYKRLKSSCEHMAKYAPHEIDTILMTSRKNISKADKEKFSVRKLVEESIHTFPLHEDFKGRIVFEGGMDFEVYGCRLFLRNVFYNMYRNAIAHALSKDGPEMLYVTVGSRWVKFEDNGKGIKKSELPYIFERFYTSSNSGTGIGLSFCQKVMLDLGGYIDCRSEEGVGTSFTLHFPRRE